jgi:hypothetical protein
MALDQRDPMHRGRRTTDWSRKRLIEIGTLVVLVISIASSVSAYFSTRWATHAEVKDAVQPMADTLAAFKNIVIPRLVRVEQRQDSAGAIGQLIPAIARYNCLVAERDRSQSLTEAAGLPCNTLLGRMR